MADRGRPASGWSSACPLRVSAWLTPRPSRKRPPYSSVNCACRAATSTAACSQMLRMLVPTVAREVAASSRCAMSGEGLPPIHSVP